jgi:hypothetical protein
VIPMKTTQLYLRLIQSLKVIYSQFVFYSFFIKVVAFD